MDVTRKVVVVASASAPDRAIVLVRLLEDAAARAGWGDRLDLRCGGLGEGAGRLGPEGRAALSAAGLEATGVECPDLSRDPALLEDASWVVCDRGDVADVLVRFAEAAEAEFLCLDEMAGADGEASDASAAAEVSAWADLVDEVLRRVIAGR